MLAERVIESPHLRRGFAMLALDPLVEFLGLLELVVRATMETREIAGIAEASVARFAERLADADVTAGEAVSVARALERAAAAFRAGGPQPEPQADPGGCPAYRELLASSTRRPASRAGGWRRPRTTRGACWSR